VVVDDEAESRFPEALDSRVTLRLHDGRTVSAYGVGHSQGAGNLAPTQRWEAAVAKFHRLAAQHLEDGVRERVVAVVADLADGGSVGELVHLLA
jgi:2-methylcitrate dehydratase PrpD